MRQVIQIVLLLLWLPWTLLGVGLFFNGSVDVGIASARIDRRMMELEVAARQNGGGVVCWLPFGDRPGTMAPGWRVQADGTHVLIMPWSWIIGGTAISTLVMWRRLQERRSAGAFEVEVREKVRSEG